MPRTLLVASVALIVPLASPSWADPCPGGKRWDNRKAECVATGSHMGPALKANWELEYDRDQKAKQKQRPKQIQTLHPEPFPKETLTGKARKAFKKWKDKM